MHTNVRENHLKYEKTISDKWRVTAGRDGMGAGPKAPVGFSHWVGGVMDFILLLHLVTHIYGTEFSVRVHYYAKKWKSQRKALDLSCGEYQVLQTR